MSPSSSNSIVFIFALIALFLPTHMHVVSAFAPVGPSSSVTSRRDVSCNVLNRNKKVSGIGGLDATFKSSSKPKTTPKKNIPLAKKSNIKKSAAKSAPVKKTQPTGSVFNVKMSEDTPWSTILVSFLIPWRNPNSIFLYLLIIVSVLGKVNEQ
jgi:hypothetical protein